MKCRLKMLREKRGLTQTGMSMLLNVSQQTISRIEAGTSKVPIDLAIQAAKYFHVSVDYFLGITDERHNTTVINKASFVARQHEDFILDFEKLDSGHQRAVEYLIHSLSQMQKEYEQRKEFEGK